MEGEEEESPTQSVSSVVERPLGTTELDTGLTFEVDLLTIAALRSICVEIAERVAVAMQRRSAASVILITDDELASAIAFWRYAETSLTALERQATVLQEQLRVPSPAKSKKAAAAFETASVVAAGIESLAEILSWLRVDTVYAGRTPEVANALRPALVGQLILRNIEVLGSEDQRLQGGQNGLLARLGRLLNQKTQLAALLQPATAHTDESEAGATGGAGSGQQGRIVAFLSQIDAWLDATFGAQGGGRAPLSRLFAASEIALLSTLPSALVLDVRVIKAGGHYRTRRHLLSTLFGRGSLSYSGGGAVAFSLTEAASGKAVASDVLYHSSGDVRFSAPDKAILTPSNLGRGGAGATPRQSTKSSSPGSVPVAPNSNQHAQQEAIVSNPPVAEQITKNSGDDEAAQPGVDRSAPPPGPFEAVKPWRVAKSLLALREQINALAPDRDRESDGAIGDEIHRTRNSDHNPWVEEGNMGVVTAIDVTHAPSTGCDANAVAESIRAAKDSRIKYIIWNRQIASSYATDGVAAWTWRRYSGTNPHTHHIHISVKPDKSSYDLAAAWGVKTKA